MNRAEIILEEVKKLRKTLEKLLLYEGYPPLSRYDFEVMQHINNIEHYLLSSANYDASSQISMLKHLVEDCTPEVAEHLKPFLANL